MSDDDHLEEWIERLVTFLRGWGVPRDAELVILPPGWVEGMDTRSVKVFPPAGGTALAHEAFLADPVRLVWAEGVAPEWISEAYGRNEGFREAVILGTVGQRRKDELLRRGVRLDSGSFRRSLVRSGCGPV